MRSSRIFSSFGKEEGRKQRRVIEFSDGVLAALYDGSFFTNDVRTALKRPDARYNKTKNAMIVNVSPHGESQAEKWVQSVLPGLLVTKPTFLGPYYGVPSLSSLFETCASIHDYLREGHEAGEQRVVIITAHSQKDPDYRPLSAVALVAACYLTYIGAVDDGIKALDVFRSQARADRMVVEARLTRDTNLPNLHQYLRLFAALRADQCFPPFRPKSIVNILAQGRVTYNGATWNPVLRIYHAAVGNCAARITTVPVKSEAMTREGLASFAVGDLFVGDVVLSFEHQSEGKSFTKPLFSVARHVAFITSPAARVCADDVEFAPGVEKFVRLGEDFSLDIFCEDRTLSSHFGGKELLDNFAVECMLVEELAMNAPMGPPGLSAPETGARAGRRRDSDVRKKELLEEVLGMEVNTITANDFLDAFKNFAAGEEVDGGTPVRQPRKSATLVEPTDPREISSTPAGRIENPRVRGGEASEASEDRIDDYSDLDDVVTMTSNDSWAGGAEGTVLEKRSHGDSQVCIAHSDSDSDSDTSLSPTSADDASTSSKPPRVEKSESRIALHQITDALNEFVTELKEEPEAWSMNGLFNRVSGILQAAPDKRVSQDIMAAVAPVAMAGPPRSNTMPIKKPVSMAVAPSDQFSAREGPDRSMSSDQPALRAAKAVNSSEFSLVTISHSPPPRHPARATVESPTKRAGMHPSLEAEAMATRALPPLPLPAVAEPTVYHESIASEQLTAPSEAAMVAAFSPRGSSAVSHVPPASPPSAPQTPLKAADVVREEPSHNTVISPLVAKFSADADAPSLPSGDPMPQRGVDASNEGTGSGMLVSPLIGKWSAAIAAEREAQTPAVRKPASITMDRLAHSGRPERRPPGVGLRNAAPISMERLAHSPAPQTTAHVEPERSASPPVEQTTTASEKVGDGLYTPVTEVAETPFSADHSVRLSVVETDAPAASARRATPPNVEASQAAARSGPGKVSSPAVETAGLIASVRRATSPALIVSASAFFAKSRVPVAREEAFRSEPPREDSGPIAWETLVPLSVLETSVPVTSSAPLLSASPPIRMPASAPPPRPLPADYSAASDDAGDYASSSAEGASDSDDSSAGVPQFFSVSPPIHGGIRARAPSISMPDAPRPRTMSMTAPARPREVPRPRTISMSTAAPPTLLRTPPVGSNTDRRTSSGSRAAPFSRSRSSSQSKNAPLPERSFLSPAPPGPASASSSSAETAAGQMASSPTEAALATSPTRTFLAQALVLPIPPPTASARKPAPPKGARPPPATAPPRVVAPATSAKATPSTAPPRMVPPAAKQLHAAKKVVSPPTSSNRVPALAPAPAAAVALQRLVPSTVPPRRTQAAPSPWLVPSTAPPRPAVAPTPARKAPAAKPARSVPSSPGRGRNAPAPVPARSVPVSPTPARRLSAAPSPHRASPSPTRLTLTRSIPSPVMSGSVIARVRAMTAVDALGSAPAAQGGESPASSSSRSPSLPVLSPSATRLVPRGSATTGSRAISLAEEVLGRDFAVDAGRVPDEFANADSLSVSFAELSPSATHAVPRASSVDQVVGTGEVLLKKKHASRSPSLMKTQSPRQTGRRSPSLMALSSGATYTSLGGKQLDVLDGEFSGGLTGPESHKELHAAVCKRLRFAENVVEISGSALGGDAGEAAEGEAAQKNEGASAFSEKNTVCAVAGAQVEINPLASLTALGPDRKSTAIGSPLKPTVMGEHRKSTVMGEHRKSTSTAPGVMLVKSRSESGAKLGKKHSDFAERVKKLARSKSKGEGVVRSNGERRGKMTKAERKEAKARAKAEARLFMTGAKKPEVKKNDGSEAQEVTLAQAFTDPIKQAATKTAKNQLQRKLTEPLNFAKGPDESEEGLSEETSPVKGKKKGVKEQIGNGAGWIMRRLKMKSRR